MSNDRNIFGFSSTGINNGVISESLDINNQFECDDIKTNSIAGIGTSFNLKSTTTNIVNVNNSGLRLATGKGIDGDSTIWNLSSAGVPRFAVHTSGLLMYGSNNIFGQFQLELNSASGSDLVLRSGASEHLRLVGATSTTTASTVWNYNNDVRITKGNAESLLILSGGATNYAQIAIG